MFAFGPPRLMQVTRFLAIGGLNTGITYGAYALLVYSGMAYWFANLLALLIGIVMSFKTQGTFVFGNPDNRLFLRFVAFWVIVYLANIALIAQFLNVGLSPYAAGAASVPLIAIVSFICQKDFVFQRGKGSNVSSSCEVQNESEDNCRGGK